MKILFIGDVVGRPGRNALRQGVPQLLRRHQIDFVIANIENAAAGFGITPEIAEEFLRSDIDVLTSGNHIFDKREIIEYIAMQPRLLRPANYPPENPGNGAYIGYTKTGVRVGVLNIQGRVFMPPNDCPFRKADQEIARLSKETNIIIVDFHGEATSEKVAFGRYVDGRVSAVLGTHTHVPTADERVLPKGTAYITDVGMTGPYESVIGMDIEGSLEKFLLQMPRKFEPAKGDPRLSGAIIDIDTETGRALSIERVQERYTSQ
jgi:metallophosphoesterase (TIGR00282 family)